MYEVTKAFEYGEPGEQPAVYAAGDEFIPPAGWREVDKSKHPTLAGAAGTVFQYDRKRKTRDQNGRVLILAEPMQVVLPVKAVV